MYTTLLEISNLHIKQTHKSHTKYKFESECYITWLSQIIASLCLVYFLIIKNNCNLVFAMLPDYHKSLKDGVCYVTWLSKIIASWCVLCYLIITNHFKLVCAMLPDYHNHCKLVCASFPDYQKYCQTLSLKCRSVHNLYCFFMICHCRCQSYILRQSFWPK